MTNLTDRRRRIIRTDGSIEVLEQPLPMTQYEKLLKADCLDTVMLRHLGEPLMVMLVIDNAWETVTVESDSEWNGLPVKQTTLHPVAPRFPINELATELYLANCRAGTTHRIAGDCAVLPDEDFA